MLIWKCGHPPCGGCGLKFEPFVLTAHVALSPSVWRVWIEIITTGREKQGHRVTLRVEGVD